MKFLAFVLIAAMTTGYVESKASIRRVHPLHHTQVVLDAGDGAEGRVVRGSPLGDLGSTGRDQHKRIISGEPADAGDYKEVCSLQKQILGLWIHVCGAVIYNELTLLTAASCVNGTSESDIRVKCGEFNLIQEEGTEQTRSINSFVLHPDFAAGRNFSFSNDLAVLELDSALTFDSSVAAAVIDDGTDDLNSFCQIMGWGLTDAGIITTELHDVTIRRQGNEECTFWWGDLITEKEVCFNEYLSLDYPCYGDFGGPAICDDVVVGIGSWGRFGCISIFFPAVYTRLSEYQTFITDNAFN